MISPAKLLCRRRQARRPRRACLRKILTAEGRLLFYLHKNSLPEFIRAGIGLVNITLALFVGVHSHSALFTVRQRKGGAVLEQKVFIRRKGHIIDHNLLIFVFIRLVHTQTEYDFGMSAGPYFIFPEAHAYAFVFVSQHGPEPVQNRIININRKHESS